MSPLSNRYYKYFVYLTLFGTFLAVLTKYDGIITVHVTPLSLRVEVNRFTSSAGCFVDPQIPENRLPEQKVAEYSRISQVHDELIDQQA
ncbi:hypothetical protein IQ259_09600 [Fortiea sp. LEGE XX443]|uniref:hypothetical protein n=1 Tax=Fortiea sp. LEGE XX443 TaxID=1828611 RepID=UPI00187E50F4|nr:hypothetical protein [Fortiea sp. LEGE XX443]MBE9005290.1 hypothetical protein [Fortiea sp. LEGE XX443]